MNHQFDELAKALAQTITRQQALKKFGVTLAAISVIIALAMAAGAWAQTLPSSGRDIQPPPAGFCNPKANFR